MPERAPTGEEMEAIREKLTQNPAVSREYPVIVHRGATIYFLGRHGQGWVAREVTVGNRILSLKWTRGGRTTTLSFIRQDLLPTRTSS